MCALRTRCLWPMTAHTGVVTAASAIFGGHCLIDSFAAAAFAAPGAWLVVYQTRFQSLFARPVRPGASLAAPEMAEPVSQFAQLMHSLGTGDHIPNLRMRRRWPICPLTRY